MLQKTGQRRSAQFSHPPQDRSGIWMKARATNLLNEPSVQAIVINCQGHHERMLAGSAAAPSEEKVLQGVSRHPARHHDRPTRAEGRFIDVMKAFCT